MTYNWWENLAASIKTKQNALEQWQSLQSSLAEHSVVYRPMGMVFSERASERVARALPHPSYDSSRGSVMCFLTRGWAGWSAGTSRTGPWVRRCLSGASSIINWNLFIWRSRGDHAILHEAYCLLSLLSEWLCLDAYVCSLLLYWPLKCFHAFLALSVLYS